MLVWLHSAGYESSSPLITLIFESQKVIYYCGYGIYFFRFGLWDWFFVKFQKIRGYDLCVNLLWRRWKGQCDKEWVLINEGQKNLCLGGFLKALCLTWRSCSEVWRWYSKFHRFIFITNCFNSMPKWITWIMSLQSAIERNRFWDYLLSLNRRENDIQRLSSSSHYFYIQECLK